MENMYDEVTIETVSHRTLQKSVYNQQICSTYFTNDQNNFFFFHETVWLPFKMIYFLGLNICRFKCAILLQRNGKRIGKCVYAKIIPFHNAISFALMNEWGHKATIASHFHTAR